MNSLVWYQKVITHAESWESQLSNGHRVGGSRTESCEWNIYPHEGVEIVISTELQCDLKTQALFRNYESPNNTYVTFYWNENYISMWRAVICWSLYCDAAASAAATTTTAAATAASLLLPGDSYHYRHRHRFCCSLLIVVCPRRCRRLYFQHCVVTLAVVVIRVVVVVLVAVADNEAMPGPLHRLRCRSSQSLLSQ